MASASFEADLVDPIEDVEEVLLGVDTDPLDSRHDLAYHPLPRVRVRPIAQPAKVRQQLTVDEAEVRAHRRVGQLPALRAGRISPVAPPIGRHDRRAEADADRLGLLGLQLLALVEDPQEQDPRQLRHVLKSAGVVCPPHDIRDLLDRGVDRRRGGESTSTDSHTRRVRNWQVSDAPYDRSPSRIDSGALSRQLASGIAHLSGAGSSRFDLIDPESKRWLLRNTVQLHDDLVSAGMGDREGAAHGHQRAKVLAGLRSGRTT